MPSESTIKLTFIGGGVLATAIIDGILEEIDNQSSPKPLYHISITVRRDKHASLLRQKYPDQLITTSNRDPRLWSTRLPSVSDVGGSVCDTATAIAHVVLVCTQPEFTANVCGDVQYAMARWPSLPSPIVVTMCPGITMKQLGGWLHDQVPIVRTMPNTPVSVMQGATAMVANPIATKTDVQHVESIFRPISPYVCILPREELLDVAASVSGSSPAYFFTFMEALFQAAVSRGIPADMASALVKQSALGSAVLAHSTRSPLEHLIKDVCVPGGSTQKGVDSLHEMGIFATIDAAIERSLVANRAMGEIYRST